MLRRWLEEAGGARGRCDRWWGQNQVGQMMRQVMVTAAVLELQEGEPLN